jgi:hypothetical protein
MIRHTVANRRVAVLALAAAAAGPTGYAYAHHSTEPTVDGPASLPTTYAGGGSFYLSGPTLDCPPPEGGPSCHITVTAKSQKRLRLKAHGSRKVRTIGKVSYDIASNRDMADIHPAVLTSDGARALKRFGKVKVVAHVTNVLDATHHAARDFTVTVKPGHHP